MGAPEEKSDQRYESGPGHLPSVRKSGPEDRLPEDPDAARLRAIGRIVALAIASCTAALVLLVMHIMQVDPSTQDASVGANYIGMAPEVEGRLLALHVGENSCVQKGQLLAEIDPHDYEVKLRQAIASRDSLDAQIADRERQIHADFDQVQSSRDALRVSELAVRSDDENIVSSSSDVGKAKALLDEAKSTYALAELTVERNRPLAEHRYISQQQFDQYTTERDNDAASVKKAVESLRSAEAEQNRSITKRQQSVVDVDKSTANLRKDQFSVKTLDALRAERASSQDAVDQARVNLERTRIKAPMNGCITALNISEGAYARTGSALFTLIDEDSWYVVAAFRESQLRHIYPGMKARIYLMSDPHQALDGEVQSIGAAVESSDTASVGGTPGSPGSLPNVERSLNWVRLASRYPVRIHFKPRDPRTLRIGTTVEVALKR